MQLSSEHSSKEAISEKCGTDSIYKPNFGWTTNFSYLHSDFNWFWRKLPTTINHFFHSKGLYLGEKDSNQIKKVGFQPLCFCWIAAVNGPSTSTDSMCTTPLPPILFLQLPYISIWIFYWFMFFFYKMSNFNTYKKNSENSVYKNKCALCITIKKIVLYWRNNQIYLYFFKIKKHVWISF